jgi:hypothetical protein
MLLLFYLVKKEIDMKSLRQIILNFELQVVAMLLLGVELWKLSTTLTKTMQGG